MSDFLESESSHLPLLFTQLQTRYPTSGLLTELVQLHADRFVVRALVQVGNVTLASSMATAASVEQAEDQARLRVLAMLGIRAATLPIAPLTSVSSYGTQVQSFVDTLQQPLPSIEPPAPATIAPATIAPATIGAVVPTPTPLPALAFEPPAVTMTLATVELAVTDEAAPEWDGYDEADRAEAPLAAAVLEEPVEEAERLVELEPPIVEAEVTMSHVSPPIGEEQGAKKPRKPTTGKDAPAAELSLSHESRDLSALISQIGVEIDRIGWSKRQGSTYLQKTYGKKTRSELTDDELEDFLTYLNTQPSAGAE